MASQTTKLRAVIKNECAAAMEAAAFALSQAGDAATISGNQGGSREEIDGVRRVSHSIEPHLLKILSAYDERRIWACTKGQRSELNSLVRQSLQNFFDELKSLPKDNAAFARTWTVYRKEIELPRSKALDRAEVHLLRSPAVNVFLQHPVISIFTVIVIGWIIEKLLDTILAAATWLLTSVFN